MSTSTSTRAGYVAVVGRPNAGKSTLMNRLVGSRLSIVTPKAQTTWERITGIRTEDGSQMIFLDTPGLLEVRDLHQRSMLHAAHLALREADVVLMVVDATRGPGELDAPAVSEGLAEADAPLVCAVNKIDIAVEDDVTAALDRARALGALALPVSAERGDGVDALVAVLEERLPPGPFLYPEDDLASQPVRFFVAEFVREAVFELYEQEVPWSVATTVEAFREDEDPLYVQVTLHVERDSQKGILIGKGGRAIKELGRLARRRIETFLGRSVYLDLWVKPLAGWRRKKRHLTRLGFKVPDETP